VNHHYLVDEVETVSHGILWTNLMFLFCLSLFPFATEWIGVKGLSSFTTSLLCSGQCFPWSWIYGAVDSDSFKEQDIGARRLEQASRVRRTLPHRDSHGLLPAGCLSGADCDRFSALVTTAKVREPPSMRLYLPRGAAAHCHRRQRPHPGVGSAKWRPAPFESATGESQIIRSSDRVCPGNRFANCRARHSLRSHV
jgi:hypothetical protein